MAKTKPQTGGLTADEAGAVAKDYVYCGKTLGKGNKVLCTIRVIEEDGTLGKELCYEYSAKMNKNVGGVYTGTRFSETQSWGLTAATWKKMWSNQEDRIKWSAENDATETALRLARLEKDEGRINDIEQIMLPLRKTYENMRFRHDWAGQEALEKAVLRALRSAPRVIE